VPGLVGDPIDVVSGAVVEQHTDFKLAGAIPILWLRSYDSRWCNEDRSLGFGHRHVFDHWLIWDVDGITHVNPAGYESFFRKLHRDGETEGSGGYTLERIDERTYHLHRSGEPTRVFHRPEGHLDGRLVELHRQLDDGHLARVALQYDDLGRLEKVLVRQNESLYLEYDASNHLIAVHYLRDDSRKTLIRYRYDQSGCLVQGEDAYGAAFTIEYDGARRLSQRTDRRGYTFHFHYDAEGRCIHSHGEDGVLSVQLEYRPTAYETSVLDANGGEWLYQYLPNGVIAFIVDPYGNQVRYDVDEQGRVVAEYDENGAETRYRFDPAGCAIAKVTPDGETIPLPEDEDDPGPKHHRTPQQPTEWEYGTLLKRDFNLPDQYEPLPELPLELRELIHTSESPERGRLRRVEDEQGLLLREELDETGQARVYGYDHNGCFRRIKDLDGNDTHFEFSSWNLLQRETDAAGNITSFEWSPTLEITSVTDPAGTTTEYNHDLKDRVVAIRRGGFMRETYAYDAADNLAEKRDANGELLLKLEHDYKGHLKRRELASGDVHEFAYEANGRLKRASTLSSECTFAYDLAGRRTEDKRDGKGVEHRYAGKHLVETTVLDRFRTTYRHDGGETLVTDPTGATTRLRQHGRGLVTRELASGMCETTQYHPRGWVLFKTLYRKHEPTSRWDRRYRYSGEGDLVEVQDTDRGTIRHEHDAAHRLARTEHPDGRVDEYQYNRAGSLFQSPTLGTGTVGQLNQLRYAGNGESFKYNQRQHIAERRSSRGTIAYDYDSRDQLGSIFWQSADGAQQWGWDADYDALGRRTRKNPAYAEVGWTYYWDTDRLAAEVAPDGRLRVYVYPDAFAFVPVAFVDYDSVDAEPSSGRRYDLLTDQRGCAERVLDADGRVVWKAAIDPYGYARVEQGGDFHQPLRMPGHYHDSETGLHYNRFRYYDPILGRYLQSDPAGLAGGLNVYAFTNCPLTQNDLRGLDGSSCPTTGARPRQQATPEGGPDSEGAPRVPAGLREALADMHGDVDAQTLRHMVDEAGADPRLVSDARVGHVDPASAALIADPSRRPEVVRNADGQPTHAVITHGPREGEHVRIISGDEAGTTVDGVTRDPDGFVVLDSRYDTVLGDEHLGTGDDRGHFRAANQRLADDLRGDPGLADRLGLNDRQVNHLLREPPSSRPPPGLTWHHHQDRGRMQLVDRSDHMAAVPHTGGMSIWGGGYGD